MTHRHRPRIRWYTPADESYEELSAESAREMRQFERDFCIAIRVAARTTPVERETAFFHGKNSVFGPTSARKIDRIASVLPDDVLAIIFEKYDNSFQKEKMKRVLRELVYVTSYIKYGFCGKQDCKCCKRLFRQRKRRGQETFLSWTYLDPDRDHVVQAFDPLFDFYSSDDGSDDNGAGDGDNAGDAGDSDDSDDSENSDDSEAFINMV